MYLPRLILRNALRHRLRTGLTVLGIAVAVLAFGLLRTVVDAWYAGADAASSRHLITRNAISLVFTLPLSYAERIRRVPGVARLSWSNWFGGIYISERNFFPRFAVDAASYLDLYPDYLLAAAERRAFLLDRRGAVAGRRLAQTYGWHVGQSIPLRGTIFPGNWEFVLRGIYSGREPTTDEGLFLFHWDYLNETLRRTAPRRADQVGVFVLDLARADDAPQVSAGVDALFRSSLAETLTETEKSFQLGFVSMIDTIVLAVRVVSLVVVGIVLFVLVNTMALSAGERESEYATLKALGFTPRYVAALVLGESVAIALAGGLLGMAFTLPAAAAFGRQTGTLFRVFEVSALTLQLQLAVALGVGVAAGVVPAVRAGRVRVAAGLAAAG